MAEGWYSQAKGQICGPWTARQLKQQADAGMIKRDTLVRKGESGKWVQALHLNGLFTSPPEDHKSQWYFQTRQDPAGSVHVGGTLSPFETTGLIQRASAGGRQRSSAAS